MTVTENRRELAIWTGVGAALAVPLALSTAYGRYQAHRDLARHPLQGRRVDVGGYRLHVRAMGEDNPGPTVLFEAGLSCPHDAWGWIQPAIATDAPTISYDRAGLGGSDTGPKPRTAARMVDELDALLDGINAAGPFVVVAHSFGGLVARAFAERHPDRIAGMVLADVAHPDQLLRSRRQRAGMPVMWAQMQQAATVSRFGLNRISGSYVMTGIQDLPADDFARAQARVLAPRANTAGCDELDAWNDLINDEVRESSLPAGCPLAVVTAGRVIENDPVHRDLQEDIAGLSNDSTWHTVDDADHLGLIMNETHAANVTAAIRDVLTRVRTSTATTTQEN